MNVFISISSCGYKTFYMEYISVLHVHRSISDTLPSSQGQWIFWNSTPWSLKSSLTRTKQILHLPNFPILQVEMFSAFIQKWMGFIHCADLLKCVSHIQRQSNCKYLLLSEKHKMITIVRPTVWMETLEIQISFSHQ